MKKANIGRSLKIALAMHDVKNIDLAESFGVQPQQVIRWKSMEDMSVHKTQDFADYFGMTLSAFIKLGMK